MTSKAFFTTETGQDNCFIVIICLISHYTYYCHGRVFLSLNTPDSQHKSVLPLHVMDGLKQLTKPRVATNGSDVKSGWLEL
jgi:hypothetical protein